jgi:hypothetical protein
MTITDNSQTIQPQPIYARMKTMAMDESATTQKHLLKEKSSLPQCKCEFFLE